MNQQQREAVVAMVPFSAHLGFELVACTRDEAVTEVTLRPEHCTSGGTAHGGFPMALADFTGAAGAYMVL
jgi:1,4-dihydroxy-2-naphthoyl-CoA hydrolase